MNITQCGRGGNFYVSNVTVKVTGLQCRLVTKQTVCKITWGLLISDLPHIRTYVSTVQIECTYATKQSVQWTAPIVTGRHYVNTVSYTGQSLCAKHCAPHRNDTQHSFVVIFSTGFLASRLGNAEYSAKFVPRPYVECGCHCTCFHEPAAFRGRILCSVSPEFIRNMGTVDHNQIWSHKSSLRAIELSVCQSEFC